MSKLNVLVVDDAPFIRDLIKKGLRNLFPGLVVDEAADGRRAQTLLGKQRFDLILCDWEMPGMTGLELLSWFRAQPDHKGVPFIMVTSRGDKENVVQAIQAGVSDYMGKPNSWRPRSRRPCSAPASSPSCRPAPSRARPPASPMIPSVP